MYEARLLRLREVPVFSLSDVAQIVSGKGYAKQLLRRMVSSGEIFRIRGGLYSFHDDPLLVSTFVVKPSYITSASALHYHRLITQIPRDVFCFTTKRGSAASFNGEIKFFHTEHFFGFENRDYAGFRIPIAEAEKAIIDSFGIIPVSVFEEAAEGIKLPRILEYVKRTDKSSIIKRVGFLLERNGFNVYPALKARINRRYVLLDPLAKKTGRRDRKWGLVVNA